VQGADIFLHKLARRANAAPLLNPTAGLGWSIAFIAFGFAQKTDAEPVGGRGISDFSGSFFFHARFYPDSSLQALSRFAYLSPNEASLAVIERHAVISTSGDPTYLNATLWKAKRWRSG